MTILARGPLLAALAALALAAACAAPPPATPGPGTPGAPAAPPTAVETPGTQPTPPSAGVGHDVQDPCGLATIEEVSAALGVQVVEAEATTGDVTTYCNYRTAEGNSVLATSYSVDEINPTIFRSFAGADDAVPVPGLGDEAVVTLNALYIRQGDAMVGIQPNVLRFMELSEQELVEMLTNLGRIFAGRL